MGRTGTGFITVTCETCGRVFQRYASQVFKRIYCSTECRCIPIEKKFWSKVDKSGGPDACWPFTGNLNWDGYGCIPHKFPWGLEQRSNRIAWILEHGQVPEGKFVLHNCPGKHLRSCCNPKHLKLGTQLDNMQDRNQQGTLVALKGSEHPNAVLSEDAVREIRREYRRFNAKPLAEKFGISVANVRDVAKRRSWRHVV